MVVTEAKFLIEDSAQLAGLIDDLQSNGVDMQPLAPVEVIDRYLDTPDWRIFRAGWAYRWREAAGERKVGLTSVGLGEGGDHPQREELEQQVEAFPNSGRRVPEGQIGQQLGAIGRKAIRELFRIQNHRRLFSVRTARGALIELAIDHATITAAAAPQKHAPGSMEFDELEMVLKEGSEPSLQEAAETVQRRFRLLPSRLSKFERGWQTVGLSPPAHARKEARILGEASFLRKRYLGKSDAAIRLAYRCFLEDFEELLGEEPRAWEGLDPEGVHQMRVATRRIRAAFRAFKCVLPAASIKELNLEFKWLAAVLGEVRDLDVYQDNFEHYTVEIPAEDAACMSDYQKYLAELWQKARKDLLACLSSQRYQQLKDGFIEFLQRGPPNTSKKKGGTLSISESATRFIGKQYKRVLQDGRAIVPDSPDESLHALRIECKRLRYLFEFFQPIYGESLNPFVKRLKTLQDVLGEFQDAGVATQQLRQYARRVPMRAKSRGQLIALGQLIYAQGQQAADRRARFYKVWKRFDRPGRRKQIVRLLAK